MNRLIRKFRHWLIRKLGGAVFEWEVKINPLAESINDELRDRQMQDLYHRYCEIYGEKKASEMFSRLLNPQSN